MSESASRHALIPDDLGSLSADRARSLLHDQRVHRIELELQNDELRASQEQLEVAQIAAQAA